MKLWEMKEKNANIMHIPHKNEEKNWQSLIEHLKNTAKITEKNASKLKLKSLVIYADFFMT
jgi:hypothetical protein